MRSGISCLIPLFSKDWIPPDKMLSDASFLCCRPSLLPPPPCSFPLPLINYQNKRGTKWWRGVLALLSSEKILRLHVITPAWRHWFGTDTPRTWCQRQRDISHFPGFNSEWWWILMFKTEDLGCFMERFMDKCLFPHDYPYDDNLIPNAYL